jgi:hypothetical protein
MKLKSMAAASASLCLAAALAACGGEREAGITVDDPADPAAEGTPGPPLRLADVVEQPARYQGQTVTVEADVQVVLGPFAFVLDEDAAPGEPGGTLIVFGPESGRLTAVDETWVDTRVRVTGRVGQLTAVGVERQVGWELDATMQAELDERQAVLIAQSLARVEE